MEISSIQPAEGSEVTMVGLDIPLEWEKKGKGVKITIPRKIAHRLRGDHPYCRHAWAVKIEKAIVH